jgi:hypothetical protein
MSFRLSFSEESSTSKVLLVDGLVDLGTTPAVAKVVHRPSIGSRVSGRSEGAEIPRHPCNPRKFDLER